LKRAALAAAFALAVIAAVGVWGAFQIPSGIGVSVVDARAFPVVLSVSLAVLAMVVLVQAARGKLPDEIDNSEEPVLAGGNGRVGWMLAAMVGSPLALSLFGFLAGGVVGFVAVARAFGARHWGWATLWGVVSTLVIWLLFDKVLTLKLGNQLVTWPF
jgi:hypothetical protein